MNEYPLIGFILANFVLGVGLTALVYGAATIIDEIKKERAHFASRLDYYGRGER